MSDNNTLRGEWRLARVHKCYPDRHNRVRNVELIVKSRQGSMGPYVPTQPIIIRRHVNNVVVLVAVEEQWDASNTVSAVMNNDEEANT